MTEASGPMGQRGFFSLRIPADLAELSKARLLMEEIGQRTTLPVERIFDLQVCVSEAAANGIEHAASAVEIEAWILPDRVIVEVTNDGVFQPGLVKVGEARRRGLGLPLMVSLADQVHVSRLDSRKTQVSLTFFLEGYRGRVSRPDAPGEREMNPGDAESLYRSLFEHSSDAIVVHIDGAYVFANPAAARLFGAGSPDELIGMKAVERLHSDDRELMVRRMNQALAGGVVPPVEGRMLRLDGTSVSVESTGSRVQFGGRLAIQAILRDVSERKQAEEALRVSEERFRLMFERHNAVMLLIDPTTGAIVDGNVAATRFYGRSRDELRASNIHDLNQLPAEQVTAEYQKAANAERSHFVFPHLAAGGETRWVDVHTAPIEIEGRKLLFSIIHDVTESKRATEELQKSEERYHALFETMNEGFILAEVITDDQGRPLDYRFLDVNPAGERYFGRSREELVGRTYRDIGGANADPEWIELLSRVAFTGEAVSIERYAPVGGQWVKLAAYSPSAGRFAAIFTDITERKQAEEALRETTRRFQTIVDCAPLTIYIKDRDGRFVFGNRNLENYAGYPIERLLGMTDYDFAQKEDADRWRENDLNVLEGQPAQYEETGVDKDGRAYVNISMKFPISDESGEPVEVCGISMDITERKRAEAALEQQARLLDLSTEAIFSWELDGAITYWNSGAERLYGFTSKEAIGEVSHELLNTVHPQGFARFRAALERDSEWMAEVTHMTKDGRALAVETRQQVIQLGGRSLVLETNRDITERKQAEEALRQSEERLGSVLASSQDVIYRVGIETGQYDYISPSSEQVLGYTPDELMALTQPDAVRAMIHADDVPAFREAIARSADLGWAEAEWRQLTKSGEYRWLSTYFMVTRDETGRPKYRTGTARDITERKLVEQERERLLAHEQALVEELAASNEELQSQTEELLASEERYRSLFESMLDGFAYCEMLLDEDGRPDDFVYLAVNPAFERLTGLTDVVGKRVTNIIPGVKEATPELFESYGRVAAGGPPERFEIDFTPLSKWLLVAVSSPAKGYFVAVFEDVTEQKQAQEALSESEERFRTMGDAIPQLAWVAKPDGYIYWYNRRWYEYTGTTPAEMEGWGWQSVHDPQALPGVLARWQQSIGTGEPFDMEFPLRGADGEFRTFLTRVMPQKDAQGRVLQWFGTNTDITERKQAEAERERLLAEEQALVEELAASNEELLSQTEELAAREQELQAQNEELLASRYNRTLLEASLDPLVTIGPDGTITDVNEAAVKIRGYSREEIIGTDFSDYFTDPEKARLGYQEAFARGSVTDYPLTIHARDGKLTDVVYNASVYKDEEGNVLGVFAAARDVTALKDLEVQREIASELQGALLDIPEQIEGVKFGHLYRSATQQAHVGGDFYDVFEVKDGQLAVLIGDVCGHGISAARTATLVKDVIHAFIHQSLRAHQVLRRTNRLLVEKNLPGFVTVFLGILDQRTGHLRYCVAGHPDALLRRASGTVEHLGAGASPLGVFPDATWKQHEVELGLDDVLVLYTDGVIEARLDGQLFGEKRLEDVLKGGLVSPERLPKLILDQVLSFSQGALQDDVAVLALSLSEIAGKRDRPLVQEKLPG